MKTWHLDLVCFAVLVVVLTLGLWPFHSPKNEVSWLGNRNGLGFGRFSTVISSRAFNIMSAEGGRSGSVEIWLQPRHIWDDCTLLAFYSPGTPYLFLRQYDAGLKLLAEIGDDRSARKAARLDVQNVFRKSGPIFLTVTSGIHGTAVYTDGLLAKTGQFRLSTSDFTGRLVIGDSPGQTDSWSGQLLGLAIYRSELTAPQVLRHYETWRHDERPKISEDERNIALYLFDERAGAVVHSQTRPGVNLNIPEKYVVLDRIFLEPFWTEFSMSRSYWSAVLKNIVGFVPFGFCFCACFSLRKIRRPTLATVILGTLVSLTIEILQAYLPTRDSGTTDLLTNALGTYMGVFAWRAVGPILAARFSWVTIGDLA